MTEYRLENWSYVRVPSKDPYKPPETWPLSLSGKVFGHKRFSDGEFIHTSTPDRAEGNVVVTISGSRYILGSIDPKYEKEFPNARERLFNAINKGKQEQTMMEER